jgi:23S rRNA (guanosine2251-2'-O)-methyltransferase
MRQVAGIHAVGEAFKVRPHSIKKFTIRDGWKESTELSALAKAAQNQNIKIESVPLSYLDKYLRGHQGVLIEVDEDPKMDRAAWDLPKRQMMLALDGIEDPQNLGAIIRTAWLMGVSGIFLPKSKASPLTAAACKAASGGAEHIPVEIHSNIAAPLNILKEKDFWIFGLSHQARDDLWNLKVPDKLVWVIGNEAKGIKAQSEKACDQLLRLPQADRGASYNASVAASLAMAESVRQWSVPRGKSQ